MVVKLLLFVFIGKFEFDEGEEWVSAEAFQGRNNAHGEGEAVECINKPSHKEQLP